ncbi:MAG: HU family DNA-binding protein [Thermotogae bacterium]|nr:HU family DNA-binding protein [Thermotogota bacterium]
MNKKELIAAVAQRAGVTKKEAANVVGALVDVVMDTLSKGESVKIVGFGTFEVVQRKARKGVNPRTKAPIKIPATKVPKFRPGKELKDKVK